jgi:hypothetical protein
MHAPSAPNARNEHEDITGRPSEAPPRPAATISYRTSGVAEPGNGAAGNREFPKPRPRASAAVAARLLGTLSARKR